MQKMQKWVRIGYSGGFCIFCIHHLRDCAFQGLSPVHKPVSSALGFTSQTSLGRYETFSFGPWRT